MKACETENKVARARPFIIRRRFQKLIDSRTSERLRTCTRLNNNAHFSIYIFLLLPFIIPHSVMHAMTH